MAKCLVTGGAGFIGSHIVERLVKDGHDVRVLDNLCTGNLSNLAAVRADIELIQGDVADEQTAMHAASGIEIIFHQAALASVPHSIERPLDSHRACATGTVSMLHAAVRSGVKRLVYAASSSAYGDQPTSAKRESDLPSPLSPYAAAKLAGEFYLQAFYHSYGLETVGLRYFNVFGPRQDPNSPYSAVIPLFVTRILSNHRPIVFGDGKQSRDFTFVQNVVDGNLLAASSSQAVGRILNVADGRQTTLLDLLAILSRFLGKSVEPEFHPARIGDVRESLADISSARRVLGYEPAVSLEEGIAKTIDFYSKLEKKSQ